MCTKWYNREKEKKKMSSMIRTFLTKVMLQLKEQLEIFHWSRDRPSIPFPPSAPENSSPLVAFHQDSVVAMNRDEGQEAGVKGQVHLLPPQNLLRLILEKRILFPMWCISSGHGELLTFIIGNSTLISWMLYCQCILPWDMWQFILNHLSVTSSKSEDL